MTPLTRVDMDREVEQALKAVRDILCAQIARNSLVMPTQTVMDLRDCVYRLDEILPRDKRLLTKDEKNGYA